MNYWNNQWITKLYACLILTAHYWGFLSAKSGVSGGIVAVVPGVMGIVAFSQPFDEEGNSICGQKMVAEVAKQLGYNLFSV